MVLVALAGCGSQAELGQVRGTVTLDGETVTSGTVRFIPTAGRAATGTIQPDGTFTLGTYDKSDGALIGRHQVVVIAYERVGGGTGGRPDPTVANPKVNYLVPQKYMAPGTSGLAFEVKPGKNFAPLELTSE